MDKKLREVKKVFEKEIPVSFTDRDKQKVLANIKQKKENPSRGTNHLLPTIITVVMITTLFFIVNHQFNFIELGFSNGNEDYDGVRSTILLDNVVSEDDDEFRFEQIPWFSTKQELIDNGHIPADSDDHITILSDGESIMLNNNITFKDPRSEAKVIYKFQYDLFIGGEYIIIAKDEDDLVRIGTDLKDKVSKQFPEPIQESLDGLSEDTIRKVRQGHSPGASWWAGDNNFEYSSLKIEVAKTPDGDGIIKISVRPPKLPEELEMELIERGLLPPHQEEVTEDEQDAHEITYETTLELSDELLDVYNQYEATLDDLLLKDLKPIDVFKLYHHARQMDQQEVVYALFIHDDIHGVPDKETYFDDLSNVDSEVMEENNRKYFEELNTVSEFKEVYIENDQVGVTYTTDSVEHDFFFRLIKDKDTDVWKVSWMPLQ